MNNLHITDVTSQPQQWIARLWRENAPLTLTGVLMIIALVLAAVGLVLDPRVITGQPAWLKPAKFAISITIYSFTFVWMLTLVKGFNRVKVFLGWGTAIALLIEFVIIALQAARGVTSHYNYTTPLDAALFSIMAGSIGFLWLLGFGLGALLLRQSLPDRSFTWSLRIGVGIALLGMGLAFTMTSPNAAQLAALQSGGAVSIMGAHTVGAVDGGAGLPLVGWSTVGGDLRVSHFFGLHGMQVLPLIAVLLAQFGRNLDQRVRVRLVVAAGVFYTGLVLITYWQALRGQPLLAPDLLTLSAWAGLLLISGLLAWLALGSARASATGIAPIMRGDSA